MSKKAIISFATLTLIIGYAEISSAKQNRGGRSASTVESAAASTQEDRLRAKFEDQSDQALADADLAPEFHADYRVKKGAPQLQVRVENLELGTVVDVYINNVKIGSATIEQDGTGTEAALDFKKGEWPAGLPMELSAGMIVRIMSGTTLLFEAPFAVK